MGTITLYKRLTRKQALAHAEEAIVGIDTFFANNPKRRVCHANIFYQHRITIKKKTVRKQVLAHVEALVKTKEIV